MKPSNIIALLALWSLIGVVSTVDDETAWNEFKHTYRKQYSSKAEEELRKKVFLENKHYMENHNEAKSEVTFTQGINDFADLTTEEVNKQLNGFRAPDIEEPTLSERDLKLILTSLSSNLVDDEADEFYDDKPYQQPANLTDSPRPQPQTRLDWRDSGRVSRVKNQGQCGSCWAFATTGALEAITASRNRSTLLSEQNLVDCSQDYGNHGCNGGLMDAALRYVRDNGIMASRDYPYTAKNGRCRFQPSRSIMSVRGSTRLPRGNESLLRLALRLSGPIPVAVDASLKTFHLYKAGIYNDNHCKSSQRNLNHAVLLIGYGMDRTGHEYWVIKNSWGTSWGERGYMKISRRHNLCGVSTYAILPIQ